MATAATFNRVQVIRQLEAHGFEPDAATGIADVIRDFVLPLTASRRGEASARGRQTARINDAIETVHGIDIRVIEVERTMATKQDVAALRQEIADLRHDLVMKFGAMLVTAVGFLTVVQAFLQ